jgi:hypothetical protein
MIKLTQLLKEESDNKSNLVADLNSITDHQVIKILELLNIRKVIQVLPDTQVPNLANALSNVANLINKHYKIDNK